MRRCRRVRHLVWPLAVAALGSTACRDELLQTARRLPDPAPASGGSSGDALDCEGGEPADELPPGALFGEGDEPDSWPLAELDYGPHEGPGLYVAARDTFRVYVNGHLVGQSDAPRAPVFVPASLLPGENVIAVAVHAASGTPAALVWLEELERSYGSGSDWKFSAAPAGEGDWTDAGYDDSEWSSAQELESIGGLAGCEPGAAFPSNVTAAWIGPELGAAGPIALRKIIRIEPVGFGAGTVGGARAVEQRVSSWEELETLAASEAPATLVLDEGEHDFRRKGDDVEVVDVCASTCSGDDRMVYAAPTSDSTCSDPVAASLSERVLKVGSNKTLVGTGRGAALRGVRFDLADSQNVIVRNLSVFDINRTILEAGDAFFLSQTSEVWIDHVTLKWVSDAFVEAFSGTEQATISYALFDGGTDAECNGQERWAMTLSDASVTVHHSRFDQVSTRAPSAQGARARVHLFNNVYSNSADWTIGASCLAQVLLEGSVFENVDVVSRLSTCSDSDERGLMNAPAGSNSYRDGNPQFVGEDADEPHNEIFVPEYDYEVEPAADAWSTVILRAGAGGPWALPIAVDE